MRFLSQYILIFLCGCLMLSGLLSETYAQNDLFRHKFVNYSVEDGLPTSVIYDVEQDSLGFIWFATESGISRFDGYKFENFTIEDGLPDNDIIGFTKDSRGLIWLHSLSGIAWCEPGLKPEFHILHEFDGYAFRSVIESDGLYWFQIAKDSDNKIVTFNFETGWQKSFLQREPGQFFAVKNGLWIEEEDEFVRISPEKPAKSIPKGTGFDLIKPTNFEGGKICYPANGELLAFDGDSVFPSPYFCGGKFGYEDLHKLEVDGEQNLWLFQWEFGVLKLYPGCSQPGQTFPEIRESPISNFCEDREGNFWFTSLVDGVYFLSKYEDFNTNFVPDGKSVARQIHTVSNLENRRIGFGTGNSQVMLLEKGKLTNLFWKPTRANDRVRGIENYGKDTIIAFGDQELVLFTPQMTLNSRGNLRSGFKDICVTQDGNIWAGNSKMICYFPSDLFFQNLSGPNIRLVDYLSFYQRGVAVWKDSLRPFLWAGNPAGLRIFEVRDQNNLGIPVQLLDGSVLDITQSPSGDIWISTDGQGIFVVKEGYSPVTYQYMHFSLEDGTLTSNTCRSVIFGDSGAVWIATNRGISVLNDFSWEKPPREQKTDQLNFAHGLLSDNVNDLAILNDTLYAGTDRGLSIFDLKKVRQRPRKSPEVLISAVKIMENERLVLDEYQLGNDERNIKFGFVALDFASQGNIEYQYKLEPLEKEWIATAQTNAHYPSLDPGDYTFKVKAISNDGKESAGITAIKVHVSPIWWDTWFFRVAVILFFVLLFGGIFLYRVRMIRSQESLKSRYHQQIADYQRQTLASQMNPHFIFNALVAVQGFILRSDSRSANKYLAKFSKLIRNVLEGSQQKTIPLSEVIKTLEIYLELEYLRFGDRFKYEISVGEDLFPGSVRIPPMILQPFVENAIRHGLKPLQGDGKLILDFQLEGEYLKCTVEDNGVGRKMAQEFKSRHHTEYQSRGMELTMKRIDLLNSQQGRAAKVEVEDLFEEGIGAKGTRVTVFFPIS